MRTQTTSAGSESEAVSYFIIAFGDIQGSNSKLAASIVFDRLFDAGVWYTTRAAKALTAGSRVLFYQNGKGFRGLAQIGDISHDTSAAPFGRDHYFAFIQRLSLTNMQRFTTPVDPRPIIDALDFVTNKKYWGHAFRTTPREISKKDYLAILRIQRQEA